MRVSATVSSIARKIPNQVVGFASVVHAVLSPLGRMLRDSRPRRAIGDRSTMSSLPTLKAHLARFAQQPIVELHRAATYARHPNRRQAFLAFQGETVRRRLKCVRGLTPIDRVIGQDSSLQMNVPSEGKLRDLLTMHGSDKASTHDYDRIYENLARLVGVPSHVLEIGLGTTGGGPSSMGSGGHPGASVRAFRDWGAEVVGADIDATILVNEPGIASYKVDQLVPRTLKNLAARLSKPLDLVIVDGLHTPEADLNSILAFAPMLAMNGLLVVEDIENVPEVTNLWLPILSALPKAFKGALVPTKASAVLLLLRTENKVVSDWSDLYPSGIDPIHTSSHARG